MFLSSSEEMIELSKVKKQPYDQKLRRREQYLAKGAAKGPLLMLQNMLSKLWSGKASNGGE